MEYLDDIIMPFGKYAGEYVCDLPIRYLIWLEENIDLQGDLKKAVTAAIDYYYENKKTLR